MQAQDHPHSSHQSTDEALPTFGDAMGTESTPVRRTSYTGPSNDDNTIEFNHMKVRLMDLEARLSHMHHPYGLDDINHVNSDLDRLNDLAHLASDTSPAARVPAKPELHRVTWVPFKNLYLEEAVYAIDVLIGKPSFYWQRRAEEREMRDRLEAAKNYDPNGNPKSNTQQPNGIPNVVKAAEKEMPDRIRINSAPVLAILSEIVGERWANGPKVFLRPYKLLVIHEKEIRHRLEVLKNIWARRPKPEDVTVSARNIRHYSADGATEGWEHDSTYEDSLFRTRTRERRNSETSSVPSYGRKSQPQVDLTTTYDALQDLTCLIEFLDEDVMPVVRRYTTDSNYSKIYFRDLWYLYQPGDFVVLDERKGKRFSVDAGPEDERPSSQPANLGERSFSIWRVLRTADGRPKLSPPSKHERNRPPSNEVNPFCVRCYRIDYDGDRFGPIWVDFDFHAFQGERLIESLDVIPLRLYKDAQEKWQRYVARGKEFMAFRTPQHRLYSGPLLNFHPSGLLFEHVSPGQRDVYGPVIVDFKETARMQPKMIMKLGFSDVRIWDEDLTTTEDYPIYVWKDRKQPIWSESAEDIYEDSHLDEHLKYRHIAQDSFLSTFDNLMQGDFINGDSFGDEEFAILPNRVCAYLLQRRRFALLKLDRLRPLTPDSVNWNDLFLARDNKETVRAQTMSHFRNKRLRSLDADLHFDLNREKGLGSIILLHGVPGVGKTSTAECVAQLLGKPLLPITCGDLGTTAEQVEQQLYEIFSKAEKWDCVLLLDEADVFLASRGKNDLKRNAVVSVFLRVLEFYTGILFLTTNRIGVLDEAFMSRIHTQLYYPPLSSEQSIKIWETNLRKLQNRKGSIKMQMNTKQILDFARNHYQQNQQKSTSWNGRQIRNACQTAAALAEHDALLELEDAKDPSSFDQMIPVVRLEVDHFVKVDTTVREFHDYMSDVCGDDYSGVAKIRGERADDFQPQPQVRYQGYVEHHAPSPMGGMQYSHRANMYSPHEPYLSSRPTEGYQPPPGGGYGAPEPQYPRRYSAVADMSPDVPGLNRTPRF